MLFAQKAAPTAQSYLEGAVAFCPGVIDEIVPDAGIIFDLEMISQTMVDPPLGWMATSMSRWVRSGGRIIWTKC